MMKSRMDVWQQFLAFEKQHQILNLQPKLDAMLDYCEYTLHTQFNKNSRSKYKFKKRKHDLTHQFRDAFKSLNLDQKLDYYIRNMKLILSYFNGELKKPVPESGTISLEVYSRSFNLKKWKQKILRLDKEKCILFAERDDKIKTYVLEDYLLRTSKNTDYYSFVLEAINKNPHEKSRTVHLGFKTQNSLFVWYTSLQKIYLYLDTKFIYKMLSQAPTNTLLKNMATSEVVARKGQGIKSEQQNSSEDSDKSDQYENKLARSMVYNQTQKDQIVFVKQEMLSQKANKQKNKSSNNREQEKKQFVVGIEHSSDQDQPPVQPRGRKKSIIETLEFIDPDKFEDIDDSDFLLVEEENDEKINIFQKIMPDYYLTELDSLVNYGSIQTSSDQIKIFSDLKEPLHIKLILNVQSNLTVDQCAILLCSPDLISKINPQVQQSVIKTLIRSENSALVSMKIKQYNRLYRPRDFIFLRHLFKVIENNEQILYFVDKSIENINYPPFTTIVRGELVNVWRIRKVKNGVQIFCDTRIKNSGYLNQSQDINLTVKYLKGYQNFQNTSKEIKKSEGNLNNFIIFSNDWILKSQKDKNNKHLTSSVNTSLPNKSPILAKQVSSGGFKKKQSIQPQNHNKIDSSPFNRPSNASGKKIQQKKIQQKKSQFHQIQHTKQETNNSAVKSGKKKPTKNIQVNLKEEDMKMNGEINEDQIAEQQKLQTVQKINRDFDKSGFVIISNNFVKSRYITQPTPKSDVQYMETINGHPIWKGQWIHDEKLGAIIFVNQKKIDDQKGVLKFILAKIGKNILSGKSVMNISLPVDIFSAQSNLELLMFSLCYAPVKIEPSCNMPLLQRFKRVVGFGISNSPLYLNMEKPFNPILGETFQCFINGCPGYAQQISHHPPIGALMFKGRGYQITAQLQSKVQLHMNSGCGTNDGIFRIKYSDGLQICYITPGGEVSGLTYGDRKFNMVGKAYFWTFGEQSDYSGIFLEVIFNPTQKGFFSVSKQQKPIDYFEGNAYTVKKQFLKNFQIKKKGAPGDKDIIDKIGKVHGIWNQVSQFNDEIILDIDNQFPAKLEYEANPLPSDANWREDITYRRIMQVTKAQSQKQRLQILQRKDRKLRGGH